MNKSNVLYYFNKLNECKEKNYLFRTRLERSLIKARIFARKNMLASIENDVSELEKKLLYICDASNVTSTGNTRSFELLKSEINNLVLTIKNL